MELANTKGIEKNQQNVSAEITKFIRYEASMAKSDEGAFIALFNHVMHDEKPDVAILAISHMEIGSIPTDLHSIGRDDGPSVSKNLFTLKYNDGDPDYVKVANKLGMNTPLGSLHNNRNGTLAHCAVYQRKEAAMKLLDDLYNAYQERNKLGESRIKERGSVRIAGLQTANGRTVFTVAYMMHKEVADFVNAHPGFEQFLAKLDLRF